MYSEPFHVPKPDAVIFEERWDKGEWQGVWAKRAARPRDSEPITRGFSEILGESLVGGVDQLLEVAPLCVDSEPVVGAHVFL